MRGEGEAMLGDREARESETGMTRLRTNFKLTIPKSAVFWQPLTTNFHSTTIRTYELFQTSGGGEEMFQRCKVPECQHLTFETNRRRYSN